MNSLLGSEGLSYKFYKIISKIEVVCVRCYFLINLNNLLRNLCLVC